MEWFAKLCGYLWGTAQVFTSASFCEWNQAHSTNFSACVMYPCSFNLEIHPLAQVCGVAMAVGKKWTLRFTNSLILTSNKIQREEREEVGHSVYVQICSSAFVCVCSLTYIVCFLCVFFYRRMNTFRCLHWLNSHNPFLCTAWEAHKCVILNPALPTQDHSYNIKIKDDIKVLLGPLCH